MNTYHIIRSVFSNYKKGKYEVQEFTSMTVVVVVNNSNIVLRLATPQPVIGGTIFQLFYFSWAIVPLFFLILELCSLQKDSKLTYYTPENSWQTLDLSFIESIYLNWVTLSIIKLENKKQKIKSKQKSKELIYKDFKFLNDEFFDKKANDLINT